MREVKLSLQQIAEYLNKTDVNTLTDMNCSNHDMGKSGEMDKTVFAGYLRSISDEIQKQHDEGKENDADFLCIILAGELHLIQQITAAFETAELEQSINTE